VSIVFFLDESGQDGKDSPYEVLAAIAVEDGVLWSLICDIHDLENRYFGMRYSAGVREIKARKILKSKTFRQANEPITFESVSSRAEYAKRCLISGDTAGKKEMTALAQAKLDYVKEVLLLCNKYKCKVFAVMIKDQSKILDDENMLRKDYVYLFERFYYYLKSRNDETGIMVFDETDKAASRMRVDKISKYYKKTEKGRLSSNLLVPEPFFVHSDLTTGVQLADLLAYILSWGFRHGSLDKRKREELGGYVEIIKNMRYYDRILHNDGVERECWSIIYI
jgi:hypothetical protein